VPENPLGNAMSDPEHPESDAGGAAEDANGSGAGDERSDFGFGFGPGATSDQGPTSGGDRERRLVEAALEGLGSLVPDKQDLPPPGTFPGYELIREIHRGGQGVVYLAIQLATKRRVAIKLMHGGPHLGSAGRARFEREVQILGQLDHPNIVKIHDSGSTGDGGWYYVMDYISGTTLDAMIEGKSLPIGQALELFGKISEAIGAAHLRGVIHRDLKPSNIRIRSNGEPVIVDFGLAKVAVPDVTDESTPRLMTMTGQFIGSLPWASPEQADGSPDKIDVRTDVYSLGVILFQMLTRRFPYEVIGNMRDVLDNILRAEPARPSTVRRQINNEVETIVLKCLSKERERRYQSAGELARDIKRYLTGQPIEAKRDSGWYVIKKTLNRHKTGAGIAGVFLATIVVFSVVMTVLYVEKDEAERLAAARLDDVETARAEEQAQRERAERNLATARSLIRTLLTEVAERVNEMRGATPVREILAIEALGHLERLEEQAEGDPGFRRDIANAADFVGDVSSGYFLPNVGDSVTAERMYMRSRQIREEILSTNPSDPVAHLDMALSHRNSASVLRLTGKFEDELKECREAVARCEEAIALVNSGDYSSELLRRANEDHAEALFDLGSVLAKLATQAQDMRDAESLARRAEQALDDAALYWRQLHGSGRSARKLAAIQRHSGTVVVDLAAVIRRRAEEIRESDPSSAADLFQRAAGELESAIDRLDEAVEVARSLSMDSPASDVYRRLLFVALDSAGRARNELAAVLGASNTASDDRLADLRTQFRRAAEDQLEIAREISAGDPSNIEARRDVALALNKVGTALEELGETEAASDFFSESLEVRQDLVRTDGTRRHRFDLVVGLLKLADVTETLADQSESNRLKLEGLRAAERLYLQAHDELAGMVDEGLMRADARVIAVTREALDACRGKIRGQ